MPWITSAPFASTTSTAEPPPDMSAMNTLTQLLQANDPPDPPPANYEIPYPSALKPKPRKLAPRKRKTDEKGVERDKRGQIIKDCGIGDCPYRTGSSGELKRHRANRHDIDVTWYPCDQPGCNFRRWG